MKDKFTVNSFFSAIKELRRHTGENAVVLQITRKRFDELLDSMAIYPGIITIKLDNVVIKINEGGH